MTRRLAVVPLFALLSLGAPAHAQSSTPLLQDDLQSNRRTRIDAGDDDAGLDAVFGGGAGGFSTKKLVTIEDRLRADLKKERPRATPRLVIFLYPGRINAERLRAMPEVFVDMELVIDPCERTVCRDAVARHIEIVGRAIGASPVLASQQYKIVFKSVTLRTATQLHDQEVAVYVVPIADCIAASRKAGGGLAWLDQRKHADTDYEPLMVAAIQKNAQSRRLPLAGLPAVHREPGKALVSLRVVGDRVRWQQQVIDAMWSASAALKSSPATPAESRFEVELSPSVRGGKPRKFRAAGASVGLYVDNRIDRATLLQSYIEEVRQGKDAAQQLDFSDADASGRGATEAAPDDNAAIAVLSSNFAALGGCARTEAARSPKFRGVTITFKWLPTGRASEIAPREPELRGGPLAKCLEQSLGALAFPRFSGGARAIEYPIRLK